MKGWASVLFNRTFCYSVHFCSVQKNVSFSTFISVQCKRTFRSLRSFPFSTKECFVLYVHFRSVQKNVLFSAFISVQCKRRFCSLRSFLFCRNERKRTHRSFGFLNVKERSARPCLFYSICF